MSTTGIRNRDPLRLDAEIRLREGTAPASDRVLSGETLALLVRLASSPETADESLKLLHELQVHQVELDLQQLQIEANERETARALARYKAIFDFAPAGYLLADQSGRVIEGNLAIAQLLGVSREQLPGLPITELLTQTSQPVISRLLADMRQGAVDVGCIVCAENAGSQPLHIAARFAPGRQEILMVVSPGPAAPAA